MWRFVQNFEVRDLGSNTVLIIFDDEAAPQQILSQGPWSFDKYLMGLYRPKDEESVDDATFVGVSFWVQFHNLPLRRMNKATAEAIGKTLGTVEQVDASSSGECRGRFLRARIYIDITKPLCRGRMVNVGDAEPQWVSFQYEKLPVFCYWCGLLNHDEKDCTLWSDSGGTLNTEDQQYGSWLRAPTNNLQQPQMVTNTTKPNPRTPRGPPRPPRPMPSPHTDRDPSTTAEKSPIQNSTSTNIDPPANPASFTPTSPTNLEILRDANLFEGHISEIDTDLKTFPTTPQSTLPFKESTATMDPPMPESINPARHILPAPQPSTLCPADTIAIHVGDNDSLHTVGPKKLLDSSQGTWKRRGPSTQTLGPPKQTLDTNNTC